MSRLFVGHLPLHVREQDVHKLFSKFGRVKSVAMKRQYAFVLMERERDAELALRELHDSDFEGARIMVELSRGPKDGRLGPNTQNKAHRVTIKGLSPQTTWQDVKDFGSVAGGVKFAEVFLLDGCKCGMLEFESVKSARRALQLLSDSRLGGRKLRLTPEDDQGFSDKNNGRQRSRSRSR